MSDERPRLTMKVKVFHDVRNDDRDVEKVKNGLVSFLNDVIAQEDVRIELTEEVSGQLKGTVEDGRIAVGHRASSVFLELRPKRFAENSLESLSRNVVHELERQRYADNVELEDWLIEATEPGQRV